MYNIIRLNLTLELTFPSVSYHPGLQETPVKSARSCHRRVQRARASLRLKNALEDNKWLLPVQLGANLLVPAVGTLVAGPVGGLACGAGLAGTQLAGMLVARKLPGSRVGKKLGFSHEKLPESLAKIGWLANHLRRRKIITKYRHKEIKRLFSVVKVS